MADDPSSTHNEVGGIVHGPSVQARDIHGGVFVHHEDQRMPVPSQLPPPVLLIGRDNDLAALDEMCNGSAYAPPTVVVVSGPAGIGKTAFAVSWAHARRDWFAGGQLFADLRGFAQDDPASPVEVLGQFLRALGVAPVRVPHGLAERAALYRSLTADRRVLVVFDDAVSAAQVVPLLPASAGSVAVVTSRHRLAALFVHGARGLSLGRLEGGAALELLGRTAGTGRVSAELDAARELARMCEGFPLALCVAAARLAARPAWPMRELVDALAEERRRLEVLVVEGAAMPTALDVSYRALPSAVARMYRLMALCPVHFFDSAVAAAAANMSQRDAAGLLAVLADANLLEDVSPGGYRFHDLIRLHARRCAEAEETQPAREMALRRVLDWYLHTAATAERVLRPYAVDLRRDIVYPPAEPATFGVADDALAWLDAERLNLAAAVRHAADQGLPAMAWQLVDATWPLFLHRGLHQERMGIEHLGLEAARSCGDPYAEAKMADRYGLTLTDLGHHDQAAELFDSALRRWRLIGDQRRVAGSLRRLALVAVAGHRLAEAVTVFEQALDAYRRLGSTREIGLTLVDLGDAYAKSGRSGEALGHLRRAKAVLADLPDPYNQARVLTKLGLAYGLGGEREAAVEHLELAATAMHDIGSPRGEAAALIGLGEVAERARRYDDARAAYRRAAELADRIDISQLEMVRDRLDRLCK